MGHIVVIFAKTGVMLELTSTNNPVIIFLKCEVCVYILYHPLLHSFALQLVFYLCGLVRALNLNV